MRFEHRGHAGRTSYDGYGSINGHGKPGYFFPSPFLARWHFVFWWKDRQPSRQYLHQGLCPTVSRNVLNQRHHNVALNWNKTIFFPRTFISHTPRQYRTGSISSNTFVFLFFHICFVIRACQLPRHISSFLQLVMAPQNERFVYRVA